MREGYIKLNRTPDVMEIIRAYPPAWIVLTVIALRAKRTNNFSAIGLKEGEALMGDYQATGLSRRQYRTALEKLEDWGLVTTKPTNKGTIVKLLNSTIYDINTESTDHQTDQRPYHQPTINRPTTVPSTDHQPTTNKNDKKEKKGKNEKNERGVIPPPKQWVWDYTRQYKWSKEECAKFYDHHEARGWVLSNGKKARDWQALVRTWESNRKKWDKPPTNLPSSEKNAIIHDYRNE